ncbi:MAG TPA: lipopolysaccharide transport periplasmic protein LptA [Thermodesulfobacteriota bacterium]|nr:lipopolysaccharide transport periplasmic protein LptA [Thermodesulfobacteriota bacterium]
MMSYTNTDKHLQGFLFNKTVFSVFLVLLLLFGAGGKNTLGEKSAVQIGILPFQIFSGEKVEYLTEVIATNLSQQLKTKEGFSIINQEEINNVSRKKAGSGTFTLQELSLIAERTGAQFLIYGSLTKIEDNLSIDARVFTTLESSPPYKDFVEGKDLDLLLKNLGDKISHHVSQVVLASPPPVVTAEAPHEPTPSAPAPGPETTQEKVSSSSVIEESSLSERKSPPPGKETTTTQAHVIEQPSEPTTVSTAEASSERPQKVSDDKTQLFQPKTLSSDQPVNITSDRMVADNRNRTVNFLGNVVAKREDMIIFSDQLSAIYTDQNKIEKIVARGNVKINQTDRTATCQEATFFQLRQQVVMTGKPKVWQGKNTITGDKIIIFVKEDRVEVESDKQESGKQGRVNAIIYPGGKGIKE